MLKRCLILRTIGPQHKYYTRPALIAPIGDMPSFAFSELQMSPSGQYISFQHVNTTHKETALRDNTLALMLFCINLDPCLLSIDALDQFINGASKAFPTNPVLSVANVLEIYTLMLFLYLLQSICPQMVVPPPL